MSALTKRGGTFTVFYFASNLDLAEQNRKSIRKALDGVEGLRLDEFPGDRLSTYFLWQPKADCAMRIAVFTPGTSLPDRARGASGTGTRDERALAVSFANLTCPGSITPRMRNEVAMGGSKPASKPSDLRAIADFESKVRAHRTRLLKLSVGERRTLLRAFSHALADELSSRGLPDELRITRRSRTESRRLAIKKLFDRDRFASLRSILRCSLCRAALNLDHAKPDLVILDEFQKYRDLLDEQRQSLATSLFNGSKVLLLSATPFGEPETLIDLVRFLYGQSGIRQGQTKLNRLSRNFEIY